MKHLIYVVFLVMALTSCKKAGVEDYFYPNEPEAHIQETVRYSVTIDSNDMDPDKDLQTVFYEKAGAECFGLAARKVMRLQPFLRGSYARYEDYYQDIYNFSGEVAPGNVRQSDNLVQDFSCTLSLQPYYSLAGEIISLEEERTIGAGNDKVTIIFFDLFPAELPAYFMIGSRVEKNNQNLISIYGSGKITQVLADISNHDAHLMDGVLAQGVILETNHEVRSKDLIFLVSMDVEVTQQEAQEITSHEGTSFTDEVWVRPEVRKTDSGPQEMK
ncbi:MAG: hypothetical protein D5R98_09450 [Desulfonatronovibrio sp. MSAO_Bac4]|nr:MAG: hypothetical protein D5R98_09450 [Desulfonatronovibrio sp. MSAO_Bac4]